MHILAVSVRYPTVFQTWFINYLASLEQENVELAVFSLFEGVSQYPERIDQINTNFLWTAYKEPKGDLTKAVSYGLKNLLTKKIYTYIFSAFKYTSSIKDGIRALPLLPGLDYGTDLIHCHSEKAAFQLLPLLKYLGAPIVLTFHGLPPEGLPDLDKRERETLYRSLALVFVNTTFAERQCHSLIGREIPTRIIPQGIDISEFPYTPRSYTGDGPLILLTVGRFDRLKGHLYAIEAIEALIRTGLDIEYWLVGAGLYEKTIRERIIDLDLTQHVKMLGSKSGEDLVSVYHQAHVFLLPSTDEPGSWAETQGIVIQEAQACGLVTIATRSGGIPECIVDGETGILIEQKSSEEIANAIQFLIEHPERWKGYQEAARQYVIEHFDYRLMGRRLLDSYTEILSEKR